jgi:hypothetical protein
MTLAVLYAGPVSIPVMVSAAHHAGNWSRKGRAPLQTRLTALGAAGTVSLDAVHATSRLRRREIALPCKFAEVKD